jgi:hypothetical protein
MKRMLRCTPFLLFDGNCAEAMSFYHSCLGGKLTLTKLADTPMKDQFPKEKHNRIINAQLEGAGRRGSLDFSRFERRSIFKLLHPDSLCASPMAHGTHKRARRR